MRHSHSRWWWRSYSTPLVSVWVVNTFTWSPGRGQTDTWPWCLYVCYKCWLQMTCSCVSVYDKEALVREWLIVTWLQYHLTVSSALTRPQISDNTKPFLLCTVLTMAVSRVISTLGACLTLQFRYHFAEHLFNYNLHSFTKLKRVFKWSYFMSSDLSWFRQSFDSKRKPY